MGTTSKPRVRLAADERRLQLIQAAQHLIADVGYQQFSITALAEECGLTRAGALHHIGSKEQILVDVLRQREHQAAEDISRLIDRSGQRDAREIFDTLMRRHLDQPEITRLFAVLGAESLAPTHPAHDYFVQRLNRGASQMAPLLAKRFRDPHGAAVEILVFMDGLELSWLRDPEIDAWLRWTSFADAYIPRTE